MHRIELDNTVFEGENNAYLFDGAGPTTLVDTGVAVPETRDQLAAGLAEHGFDFADVDQVLLTHFHEDHAGLAGEIQRASGATVRAHEADAPLVARDPDAEAAMEDDREAYFESWGIPPEPRAELRSVFEAGSGLDGDGPDVTPFEGGDRFEAGDETLEAVHLPGHTAGLSGFVRETEERRELFSGDALLPVYTPNVGGADTRVENPLASYLSTLDHIVTTAYGHAWPGHRDPIPDPTARARHIIDHHYERTERVVGVLEAHGPADAWTVSAHLFGDLESIHILHGPGEAYAHLDHLTDAGVVENTPDGYELVDEDADLRSLFPDSLSA